MTSRLPARRLLLLGMPHPATRALAAYVERLLATVDPPVGSVLSTDDRAVAPIEVALHLRPQAMETLDLAASLSHGLAGAGVLAARQNEGWRGVPQLAVERVLANPAHAAATLASCLDVPMTGAMLAAADGSVAALRDEVAAFAHPLAFWLACDPHEATTCPEPEGLPETREHSQGAAARAAARKVAGDPGLGTCIFVLAGNGWTALPGRGR